MTASQAESVVDHASLMDKVYRRQRHFYDFTRKYYLFGRDSMIAGLDLKPGERLIEVGCGTARNLVRIAGLYPNAKLFGLDASAEMLRTAAANLKSAGLNGRVHLVQAYAEALSPSLFGGEAESFDRILFPYSLSMIPDWRQALQAAALALKPGGRIHVVDFGDLEGLGAIGRPALRKWLDLFHVSPRVELLKSFEAGAEKQNEFRSLRLLMGRYAFVAAFGRTESMEAAGKSVAA